MFWALKAFFCSNIKSVLESDSQLQAVKARDAIHDFVCIPMAIKIAHIKTHNIESQGQEEAATTKLVIYMEHH